jgi:hypothetical protein
VHLTDILHKDGGAVGELDRNVVEIVDRGGHRIGADGKLGIADLGRARRQGQVLGVDGIDHVERREPLGLQLQRIEIDHDLAVLAAGRGGQGDDVDGRELLPQAIYSVVVKLLLVQRIG